MTRRDMEVIADRLAAELDRTDRRARIKVRRAKDARRQRVGKGGAA